MGQSRCAGKGKLFAVLKSFYDRSGQENDSLMTLAGIATNDSTWQEIEQRWRRILDNRDPPAKYWHSVEASHLRGEFKKQNGWDETKVENLASDLMIYLTTLDKAVYFQQSVTVDMSAYGRLQALTYQMDSSAKLCTERCTDEIMNWYVSSYQGIDMSAEFFFDQNEPFEEIFRAEWQKEVERARITGIHNLWCHIVQVRSATKEKTPGVQIADMFAWGVNRVVTGKTKFAHLALAMSKFLNSRSVTLGEPYLRRRFRPLLWL